MCQRNTAKRIAPPFELNSGTDVPSVRYLIRYVIVDLYATRFGSRERYGIVLGGSRPYRAKRRNAPSDRTPRVALRKCYSYRAYTVTAAATVIHEDDRAGRRQRPHEPYADRLRSTAHGDRDY
jgi:hypothetical protein